MGVNIFFLHRKFTIQKPFISKLIKYIVLNEKYSLGTINIIFCSNKTIFNLNKKFLKHNYLTDVITFDYCEANIISGDIFIATDVVKYNSIRFNTTFKNELFRVIIHGVLHLLKYDDKNEGQSLKMRKKEDIYLSLIE